ncbi:unnamed protein product [Pleuronectes platessa]|uniref:Uncharacterized protein n=1 Tax=Pleuronectes platessa TaxID=8262 RepID=A0A9N7VZ17_PLEPL|nr:unnamed protein product [Pleuronectes platessa]
MAAPELHFTNDQEQSPKHTVHPALLLSSSHNNNNTNNNNNNLHWSQFKSRGLTAVSSAPWSGAHSECGAAQRRSHVSGEECLMVGIVGPETQNFTFTHPPAAPQQGAEMHPCRSPHFGGAARSPSIRHHYSRSRLWAHDCAAQTQ